MDLSRYWKTVVDTLQDGVLVVDPKGTVLSVNPAAERLTGYTAEEIVGRSCTVLDCTGCEIFGKGEGEKWCGLYEKGGVTAKKCMITNKNHRHVNIVKNATVLKDTQGHILGAVETLTDMSEIVRQEIEINELRKSLHLDEGFHGMLGKSQPMLDLFELLNNVASTESPVMIFGESGTGKELVARATHEAGPRKGKPFIKVNCASLNENLLESELFGHTKGAYTGADRTRIGRFEAAHEGSIFLDEIGDIPLSTQVKLLRVLEDKEVERVGENEGIPIDVRLISATNRDLDDLIDEGVFREDLFFRINVFPLQCPALRDRKDDIPIIAQYYIDQNNIKTRKKISGVHPKAMKLLTEYPWPGNVRELKNAIEYAFVLCQDSRIDINHLPAKVIEEKDTQVNGKIRALSQKEKIKKDELIRILKETNGNQSEAARIIGVSRVTVWKRIKKYGINFTKKNSSAISS